MKFWFLTDTGRLGLEKKAVEALAAGVEWFSFAGWAFHEGHLVAIGGIAAHGHVYPIRLVYPDQFPEVPAWVEPRDDVKWTHHQYGSGGALCLELRPDNWMPAATGSDVLRSAFNLLATENPLGAESERGRVESAHHVSAVQSYTWGREPVLIGAGCLERLLQGEAREVKALRWMSRDDVWPIMVHDAQDRLSPRRPPSADIESWRFEIPVLINTNSPPPEAKDRHALLTVQGFEGQPVDGVMETGAALVLFSHGKSLTAYHLLAEGGPFDRKLFVLPEEDGIRSGRTGSPQQQVAIIGLGSIGSKLAEILLRSGVWKQLLVDGDIFLPANLERHALDWRNVGYRKVNGVQRRLLDIVPGADITAIEADLNWQRSARTHAAQVARIGNADVIIDATGDPATTLFLGAVAHANGKPFVAVEVFEGGIGALVAACVPQRDPPYVEARAAFLGWCDEQAEKPPTPAPGRYGALDDDGKPIVADDAAATMAAGHAARVVLDSIDGRPADGQSAWLLLGFRKGWVFEGHGHTIRMSVGKARQVEGRVDEEAKAFVLELLGRSFPNAGEPAN